MGKATLDTINSAPLVLAKKHKIETSTFFTVRVKNRPSGTNESAKANGPENNAVRKIKPTTTAKLFMPLCYATVFSNRRRLFPSIEVWFRRSRSGSIDRGLVPSIEVWFHRSWSSSTEVYLFQATSLMDRGGTKYFFPLGEIHWQEPSAKLSSFQSPWVLSR